MRRPRPSRFGLANLSLGLSILFAVVAFGYFSFTGLPFRGALVGLLVIGAGYWEYRRKIQDQLTQERYEAEAEEQRRQDRQ